MTLKTSNKTIIPLVLVGYDRIIANEVRRPSWLCTIPYPTRLWNIFNCYKAGVFPATARSFIGLFMVTWHLIMKLFPAKCHKRATLRKLWRQKGNSSLLPTKCWLLSGAQCAPAAVARDQRWPAVVAGISTRFSKFAFALFCSYITNHLMTGPLGNSEFSFPSQCFPRLRLGKLWDSREAKSSSH